MSLFVSDAMPGKDLMPGEDKPMGDYADSHGLPKV